MKSTIRSTVVHFSVLAVAIFVLVGCQKSIVPEGLPIRFAISAENVTKGELINTDGSDKALADKGVTSFKASAYNGTSPVFTTLGLDPANVETVSYSGGVWTMANTYYWPQATSLNFYACANMPASTVATADFSASAITLDYLAVPEDASAQKDILFGHYQGNGGNTGTARIHFEHPLTAVRFLRGDIDESLVIKSISIKGVAASGTATMDVSGAISWSEVSAYTHTVSQTKDSGLPVHGTTKLIGEPFIIIPQDLAVHNVTVSVVFTDGTVLETTISSGQWLAGYTNAYTLNYDITGKLTVAVTPWDEEASIPLVLVEEKPELLPGKFSVSASEYVQFSRGNLYCLRSGSVGSYTYEYGFENEQYEYRTRPTFGSRYGSVTTTPSNVSGLFSWACKNGAPVGDDFGAFNESAITGGVGTDVMEWGLVFGEYSDWYTFTAIEWEYMLKTRANAMSLRKSSVVNGVKGLVLAPDGYTGALADSYDLSAWITAEAEGLVFLPYAGYYWQNNMKFSQTDTQPGAFYYTSVVEGTTTPASQAVGTMFSSNTAVAGTVIQGRSRVHALAVRLVKKSAKEIFEPNYIDLGLPSGTLWADRNIGAVDEQNVGYYFPWGETTLWYESISVNTVTMKSAYTNFSEEEYNSKSNMKTVKEDLTGANAIYDVANVTYGNGCRMPSISEYEELLNNCYLRYVTEYNGQSVTGYIIFKVKAEADKGKKSTPSSSPSLVGTYDLRDTHIFMPFTGFIKNKVICSGGISDGSAGIRAGYYWSSTSGTISGTTKAGAERFSIGQSFSSPTAIIDRYPGMPVRAVKRMEIPYVEVAGLRWAKYNVGAREAKDNGLYFSWGSTTGYRRNSSNNGWVNFLTGVAGSFNTTTGPSGEGDFSFNSPSVDVRYDAARAIWGGNWRVPTISEFSDLLSATYWAWSSTDKGFYVFLPDGSHTAGTRIDNIDGLDPNDAILFFPAAGYGDSSSLNNNGTQGIYWSSQQEETYTSSAKNLEINSSGAGAVSLSYGAKSRGRTIRAVMDIPTE